MELADLNSQQCLRSRCRSTEAAAIRCYRRRPEHQKFSSFRTWPWTGQGRGSLLTGAVRSHKSGSILAHTPCQGAYLRLEAKKGGPVERCATLLCGKSLGLYLFHFCPSCSTYGTVRPPSSRKAPVVIRLRDGAVSTPNLCS